MSDQSQTTANTPTENVHCKAGCGFFGNAATGGCCSKCWREQQKKNGADNVRPTEIKKTASLEESKNVPSLVVDRPKPDVESGVEKPAAAAAKKGKKKKKASYKAMMCGVMSSSLTRDIEAEQLEKISKGVGGGAFSKIDKI